MAYTDNQIRQEVDIVFKKYDKDGNHMLGQA